MKEMSVYEKHIAFSFGIKRAEYRTGILHVWTTPSVTEERVERWKDYQFKVHKSICQDPTCKGCG